MNALHELVASIYNQAVFERRPPVPAIMEALEVSRPTAGRRIEAARRAGALPPAERGRVAANIPAHHPVLAEIQRGTKSERRVELCGSCLTPWPCEHHQGGCAA